jgi:lipopolysaccharide export system permease protein
VLFPLGIFLTYKAATDSVILNIETYLKPFTKLFKIKGKVKKAVLKVRNRNSFEPTVKDSNVEKPLE